MAAAHPLASFLSFPAELHIKILLQLDNRSFIRCSSVCRDLRVLISSEVALQYKVELAKAGMIEDPLGSAQLSLPERLEKVRAYRAAWKTPSIVFDTRFPQRPDRLTLLPMTSGVLPFVTTPPTINFWKPGSSVRGVPEVRKSFSTAPLQNVRYSSISVDLERDLVVLTTELWHPGTSSVNEYRVHLLTTACTPHPLAALPEPRGPGEYFPPPYMPTVRSTTEIFGDLVAWSASTNPGQIQVWNWKTGDVLLRITPNAHKSCFKFLDDSHLLVLFDQDLRIYDFSQPTTSSFGLQPPPAPPPFTKDDCPCVLRLPPFAHGAVHAVDPKLYMQSSPSSPATAPQFHHDPAQKIVCLAFRLVSIGPRDRTVENYMFLMPVSALLSQFQFQRARASESGTCDVPWEDWGPPSCRVLRTQPLDAGCVGVAGTKVVVSTRLGWDEGSGGDGGRRARVLLQVVDVNPFAVGGGPSSNSSSSGDAPSTSGSTPTALANPGEGGCIADCQLFRGGSVRSELPYTIAAHEVELELEDGAEPQRNDGHELFVFEDGWILLYTQRADPGALTQFTPAGVHTMQI